MKRTKKYVAGEAVALKAGLTFQNQTDLYEQLEKSAYMWDSIAGEWLHLPSMEADDPSPLIKVRVWSDIKNIDAEVDSIVYRLSGYVLIKRSKVVPCRPPKQREGRVYLTFAEIPF